MINNSTPPHEIATVLQNLTNRELLVLQHVSQGLCSEEIADLLFLSKDTVDTHRRNVLDKWREATSSPLFGKKAGRIMVAKVRPFIQHYS